MRSIAFFGKRLAEERLRLGLNQTDFSAIAKVGLTTQVSYETDKSRPDADYLAAISSAGADVVYIITGQRTPRKLGNKVTRMFLPDEMELIDNYSSCLEMGKKNDNEFVTALTQQAVTRKQKIKRCEGESLIVRGRSVQTINDCLNYYQLGQSYWRESPHSKGCRSDRHPFLLWICQRVGFQISLT